jgi:hypothetical protein
MTIHRVSLDIFSRIVEINSPEYGHTILHLPQQEYISSCVYTIEGIKLEDIPIVCEYPDVFRMSYLECPQIGMLNLL